MHEKDTGREPNAKKKKRTKNKEEEKEGHYQEFQKLEGNEIISKTQRSDNQNLKIGGVMSNLLQTS